MIYGQNLSREWQNFPFSLVQNPGGTSASSKTLISCPSRFQTREGILAQAAFQAPEWNIPAGYMQLSYSANKRFVLYCMQNIRLTSFYIYYINIYICVSYIWYLWQINKIPVRKSRCFMVQGDERMAGLEGTSGLFVKK